MTQNKEYFLEETEYGTHPVSGNVTSVNGGSGSYAVLIIDDNEQVCRLFSRYISKMGMEAHFETTLQKGVRAAKALNYDVILLDLNLPDGNGLDALPQLRQAPFPPEIIIVTGYGDDEAAATAIQNDAWDYIQKGDTFHRIRLSLTRAIQYRAQRRSTVRQMISNRGNIIGTSDRIVACIEQAFHAAHVRGPVLVTGETGTGKELFARLIHDNAPHQRGNFVIVDCAALPEHLVESTLFGHKRGAFTGADRDREGLIRQADNGALFLDEIGEMPLEVQKKFLRVLQEKRFRPVGGKGEIESDFRLISATHRNLAEMVKAKRFREDLYYRIRAIHIEIPPLRERIEDIPTLVRSYIHEDAADTDQCPKTLSPDFMEALMAYEWPGNVRELLYTIDSVRAEALNEPMLFARHLPNHIRASAVQSRLKPSAPETAAPSAPDAEAPRTEGFSLKDFLETMKRKYITELIAATRGDIPEACRRSGVSRAHLYQLLKKYDIQVSDFR